MANDIFDLHEAGVVPGLIGLTSLVKGAANRLSLAGLVRALADSTTDPPTRGRSRRRGEFAGDPMLAELAIYLALRLLATGTPVDEWDAHSVDPVDIEPFFDALPADAARRRAPRAVPDLPQPGRVGRLPRRRGGARRAHEPGRRGPRPEPARRHQPRPAPAPPRALPRRQADARHHRRGPLVRIRGHGRPVGQSRLRPAARCVRRTA